MRVHLTRLSPDVPLPQYETPGAVAFDLAVAETVTVAAYQIARLRTGLIVAPPPGFALVIAPRSSAPVKRGLSFPHGIGIVDQDFCGPDDELKLQVYNFTDQPVTIQKGERIAQGMFVPIERAEWQESPPAASSRGGFGSTDTVPLIKG
ncbi:dUTP diphosphatase [Candidatus Uhrbacteria bacterium]|nr:dUTP diphosphatase [Candidatus Uhrbacteria bacterium]